MTESSLPEKVERYEQFLNERLRSDLRTVLSQRDRVYSDITELTQLKQVIAQVQTQHGPLKTLVDIGCNTYAQARVNDCSKICVAVGLGFFLEMELGEASRYVEKRIGELNERAQELSQQSSQINARIKIVLQALTELQLSTDSPETPHRHVW